MDKNIKKALRMLEKLLPSVELPDILVVKRKKDQYLGNHPSTVAYYDGRKCRIVVAKDALDFLPGKKVRETIYHEVGHFIHHKYFLFQAQYLPRKHHGDAGYYCNKNQKESFASCFADWCKAKEKEKEGKIQSSPRLSKMERLLVEKQLVSFVKNI